MHGNICKFMSVQTKAGQVAKVNAIDLDLSHVLHVPFISNINTNKCEHGMKELSHHM